MTWKTFWSPALKIAGGRALLWGVAGLAVSVVCATFSGWHARGLMHFGPAPRDAWWISVLEYLIIWLVPAAIFYGMGSALSRSRIRPVDILGTTAFALLPLTAMNLWQLIPGMQAVLDSFAGLANNTAAYDTALVQEAIKSITHPLFILSMIVAMATTVLLVVWLFNAVRVSCNLSGGRLWAVYLVGLIGGDALCSYLIGLMY